eukprot:7918552-Lingulodinium_polyedra.AAC.1
MTLTCLQSMCNNSCALAIAALRALRARLLLPGCLQCPAPGENLVLQRLAEQAPGPGSKV